MGKQSNWVNQYRKDTTDLTNRKGRRCRMSSQFSSPTLRLEHDVLCNYCRSAVARVSLGGADRATSLNHLAASRTLPRKDTGRRRGNPPLVAEEALVVARSSLLFPPQIYQEGIGRPGFPLWFICKQGGLEGGAGNSKIWSPSIVVQSGKRKSLDHGLKRHWLKRKTVWVSDPNASDLT
jgi:hypothetical protein